MKFLADENFNHNLLHALRHERPDADVIAAQDVGLLGAPDPEVLEYAASTGRVLLTHDYATMANYASQRVAAALAMPGVLIMHQDITVAQFLLDSGIIIECATADDMSNQIR